ncbi:MAG TPA: tyrosine-type recombinase/integrase [Gammaproteobacteria bacterium]|nr:tyrosine-type recombinase/integrase [Gammaproteobacteria bacterium]
MSRADSVSQAVDRFLSVVGLEVRLATVSYYAQCLRPLRDLEKPISEVDVDDLRALYADLLKRRTRYAGHPSRPELAGGLSVYTLHKYVRAWKRFFRWMVEESMIARDPSIKLKRPRLPDEPPKDVTPDDLRRMLEAARDNPRDYAIVCFLADTACRVGGLVSLRRRDIDLDEGFALVREKGDQARLVYFTARTAQAVAAYLDADCSDEADMDSEFVFRGLRGPLTTAGVYQALRRLARRAGVKGRWNPHAFRHAWARQALKRSANLQEVSEILGHRSIVVTAKFYARYLDRELQVRHGEVSWMAGR